MHIKLKTLLVQSTLCINCVSFACIPPSSKSLPKVLPNEPKEVVNLMRKEAKNAEDEDSVAITYQHFFIHDYFKNGLPSAKFINHLKQMHHDCIKYELFNDDTHNKKSTLIYDVIDTCTLKKIPQQQIILTKHKVDKRWVINNINNLNEDETLALITKKASLQAFYNQFILALRSNKKESINAFFSDDYQTLESTPLARNFNHSKCQKFTLNHINATANNAKLSYTIYSMCDPNALPTKHIAMLSKEKQSWKINKIVETKSTKKHKDIDHVFSEYLAIDAYHKYLKLMDEGKVATAKKRYLSAGYLEKHKATHSESKTNLTINNKQNLSNDLQCQKQIALYHTKNALKQRVYFKIANQCSQKYNVNMSRVDFKHHDGKWLIDNITFF